MVINSLGTREQKGNEAWNRETKAMFLKNRKKKKNFLGARQRKENFVRNKGTEVFLIGNSFFLSTPCWKERKNSMKLNTLLTHNPFCPSSEKMCFSGPKHNWFKY